MLNENQIRFICSAIELNEAVIDYDINNTEFIEIYGTTKKKMKRDIEKLKKIINL